MQLYAHREVPSPPNNLCRNAAEQCLQFPQSPRGAALEVLVGVQVLVEQASAGAQHGTHCVTESGLLSLYFIPFSCQQEPFK